MKAMPSFKLEELGIMKVSPSLDPSQTKGLDAREHNLKAGAPRNVRGAAFLSFPFLFCYFFFGEARPNVPI